jgi:hypothetical protein
MLEGDPIATSLEAQMSVISIHPPMCYVDVYGSLVGLWNRHCHRRDRLVTYCADVDDVGAVDAETCVAPWLCSEYLSP